MRYYGLLAETIIALARPFLNRKYDEGNDQRFGYYSDDVPRSSLWIHALSVGEVQSAYSLIKQVKDSEPGQDILISTITKTGKTMVRQLIEPLARQIYYPWDAPSVINRALDKLCPCAYITMETESWPEMLYQLHKRQIPAFLVNGRISLKSFKQCYPIRALWQKVFPCYTMIMARSEPDRDRFIKLGAVPDKIIVTGDGKIDALIERKKTCDLSQVKQFLPSGGPVILAGSTHEGEETIVLSAFLSLRERFRGLKLVIVPRHPERAVQVQAEAEESGLKATLVSSYANTDWHVLVVDRIGLLFPFYAVAQAAFIGRSITAQGGQNIMEPAIWGIPFCQGPNFQNFTEATEELSKLGLCSIVHDVEEMSSFFEHVLNENATSKYAESSRVFFDRLNNNATHKNWEIISKILHEKNVFKSSIGR